MTTRLAERYERLLDAYPEGYRAERGPEILGTLLDGARPDQRWPSVREAVSLLGGAVRTRLAGRSPSLRAWWYGVAHMAVLLILIPKVYRLGGNYARIWTVTGDLLLMPVGWNWVWLAAAALVLVAVLLRSYRTALVAAGVLAALELVVLALVSAPTDRGEGIVVNITELALLLALLIAVVAARPPRGYRPPRVWMAVVVSVAVAAPPGLPFLLDLAFQWDIIFAFAILTSLLLGLFDARVPAAMALYLLGSGTVVVAFGSDFLIADPFNGIYFDGSLRYVITTLASAALLVGASTLVQRWAVRL